MVEIFPETDFTDCCWASPPCFACCWAAEPRFADTPRTSRPAREAQETVFRIIDIGVCLLVNGGWNHPSQSAKKCATLRFPRPTAFSGRRFIHSREFPEFKSVPSVF